MNITKQQFAKLIDHTLLRPDASEADIMKLCNEADESGFHAVCVNPSFIPLSRAILLKSMVKIVTVIGFPLGMSSPGTKTYEAMDAVMNGADELDIVMNIGFAKSGKWEYVEKELSDIVSSTPGIIHKVIIEACFLSNDEKIRACEAAMQSGARFVKTSTGFGSGEATLKDVALLKKASRGKIGIKVAGGIRTLKDATAFIGAGATRIGTSAGIKIISEIGVGSGTAER